MTFGPSDAVIVERGRERAISSEGAPPGAKPGRPRDWRRIAAWFACALPVVIFGVLAWQHRWMLDDGYINFRVVRQIEAGNGPVYNSGQRVEAFTSPLWIAVLTVGDVLTPIRLEWLSVFAGIGAAIAGLGLAVVGSARLWRVLDPDALLLPAGVLISVALLPMWYFASSGLESGMVFGWMGLCLFLLGSWARHDDRDLSLGAAVVIGLGWLIRPELALVSLTLLIAVIVGRNDRSWRAVVKLVVAAFALPVLYQLFRMGYYASLVSNTAYAKRANAANWSRGAEYLQQFVDDYLLWIPVVVVVLAGIVPLALAAGSRATRRTALVTIAFVAGGVLVGVFVVRVGGDYIPARLLLPALFAICLPAAVLPLRWLSAAALAVLLPWALVCGLSRAGSLSPFATLAGTPAPINVEDALGQPRADVIAKYRGEGVFWEGQRLPYAPNPALPRRTGGLSFIGATGFVLGPGVDILDSLGLADALTARFREVSTGSIPGHEKPLPAAWAAARLTAPGSTPAPEQFQFKSFFSIKPLIPQTDGTEFLEQVAMVRRALGCGALKQFRDSYSRPLTLGRFFDNVGRSVTSFGFSIPADPGRAVREFCPSTRVRASPTRP